MVSTWTFGRYRGGSGAREPWQNWITPTGVYDAYALTEDAVQDPPRTLGRALRQIGPGLILAGAIVGTGELIATTNLGREGRASRCCGS